MKDKPGGQSHKAKNLNSILHAVETQGLITRIVAKLKRSSGGQEGRAIEATCPAVEAKRIANLFS